MIHENSTQRYSFPPPITHPPNQRNTSEPILLYLILWEGEKYDINLIDTILTVEILQCQSVTGNVPGNTHLFWFFAKQKTLVKFQFIEDTAYYRNGTVVCSTMIKSSLLQQLTLPCHVLCKGIMA